MFGSSMVYVTNLSKGCVFLLFFIVCSSSAQDIQEVLQEDVCLCINKQSVNKFNPQGTSVLKTCLLGKTGNYSKEFRDILIDEHFIEKKNDDSGDYDLNFRNLKAFIDGHPDYFIHQCDIYYKYVIASRIQELRQLKKDHPERSMRKLTKSIQQSPKIAELYLQRGKLYLATGAYLEAKYDFYKCLDINPDYQEAIYLLGFTCELNEEYGVAKGWYNQLIKEHHYVEASIALEVTKRRIKEKEDAEAIKLFKGYMNLLSAAERAKQEKISDDITCPVIEGCEDIVSNVQRKKCLSNIFKHHVNHNFNVFAIEESNRLGPGMHYIYVKFKISETGEITDIKLGSPNFIVLAEVKRVLGTLPKIIKPAYSKKEKVPKSVLYSLPIKFYIHK